MSMDWNKLRRAVANQTPLEMAITATTQPTPKTSRSMDSRPPASLRFVPSRDRGFVRLTIGWYFYRGSFPFVFPVLQRDSQGGSASGRRGRRLLILPGRAASRPRFRLGIRCALTLRIFRSRSPPKTRAPHCVRRRNRRSSKTPRNGPKAGDILIGSPNCGWEHNWVVNPATRLPATRP